MNVAKGYSQVETGPGCLPGCCDTDTLKLKNSDELVTPSEYGLKFQSASKDS